MKISYQWIKQFVPTDWNADKTATLLTDLGLEVEGIEQFESVPGGLQGLVVGKIITAEKHPNADRLQVTTVDVGNDTPLSIVCGAKNAAAGLTVVVAPVGTTIYPIQGDAWTLEKGKIRGVESHGMICAEDEIGLGTDHSGIMILEDHHQPGTPLNTLFDIEKDQVFEIGLTPNRSDAMSHYGVARDLRAGLKQQGIAKELIFPSTTGFAIDNRTNTISVDVQDAALAPRYCGITISGLSVQPSPSWLQNRLKSIGLKPINNVVDATNYVLHEIGQPLHAFDADRIEGGKINVRTVASGTKFTTLDGVERTLHPEDLMICDAKKPLCIAGVFGGLDSGVTDETKNIFLESAYFNPVSVRKTAKRHGLSTDASFRFERGIDIELVETALKRAALLIKEIAGGQITSEIEDLYPKKAEAQQVFLSYEKIKRLIGQEIPADTIKSILASLEIKILNSTETGMGLAIPPYRVDVQREVDVVEEILRVYGYNNIDYSSKLNASIAIVGKNDAHLVQKSMGEYLASVGYFEIMTNSLTAAKKQESVPLAQDHKAVDILNPLSQDLAQLRTSMLFSGLEVIKHNNNRKRNNQRLFEFGKTYVQTPQGRKEQMHLCLWGVGKQYDDQWITPAPSADFFAVKTSCEQLLQRCRISATHTSDEVRFPFRECLHYYSAEHLLFSVGLVDPKFTEPYDVKTPVAYAAIDWDQIQSMLLDEEIKFKSIPKYPSVSRDLALLVGENTTFEDLKSEAYRAIGDLLVEVALFDVYSGKNLAADKKSYGMRFTLSDAEQTLTEAQIDRSMKKLLTAFEQKFNAHLR